MGKGSEITNLIYEIPNEEVLRNRKIFYTITKGIEESIVDWFKRIQNSVNGCDFGEQHDAMLIDKFISGLSDDLITKFTKTRTLTTNQLLSIAASSKASVQIKNEQVSLLKLEFSVCFLFHRSHSKNPTLNYY